jgi:glycosyltransferase 2 family protein
MIKTIIKCMLTISIVIYLFMLLDLNSMWQGFQKISISALAIVVLCCFFSSLCQALRWCYMTKDQFSSSYLQQMLLFWKASFFNLITPASLGGDIYRVVSYRKTQQGSIAFGLVIKERFLGLLGMFLCYLLFLLLLKFKHSSMSLPSFFLTLGIFFIFGMTMLILLQGILSLLTHISDRYFNILLKSKITHISKSIRYKSKFEFLVLITLTLLSTLNWTLVFYSLTTALSYSTIKFEEIGLISIITEISRWVPVTIQGIGLREGAAVYAFNLLGYSFEIGFLVSGLAYLINTFVLMFLGVTGFLFTALLSYKKVNISSFLEVK